jgi:hypothetical protein
MPKGRGFSKPNLEGIDKYPPRGSKQLPVREVLQLRLLSIGFRFPSPSLMPDRYTPHPAFICPLSIPDRAGYLGCRDFSVLGWFNV